MSSKSRPSTVLLFSAPPKSKIIRKAVLKIPADIVFFGGGFPPQKKNIFVVREGAEVKKGYRSHAAHVEENTKNHEMSLLPKGFPNLPLMQWTKQSNTHTQSYHHTDICTLNDIIGQPVCHFFFSMVLRFKYLAFQLRFPARFPRWPRFSRT